MAIVFVGHGGRQEGNDIPVPPGVTVKFFVDFDMNMSPINVETVLSRREFGSPNQEYVRGGGDVPALVPNYSLSPLKSEELQADLSSAMTLDGVIWTEVRTKLCLTPEVCAPLPAHTCDGILGQAARAGEVEVVFLACRGVIGRGDPMSSRLGAPGEDDESVQPELLEWARDFLARAALDQGAAATEWDSLPEATRAMLMNLRSVRAWSENRERTAPSEPAALLEARRYLESHGDVALADWADQWDDTQWRVIGSDPAIREAYERGRREREALRHAAEREELLGDRVGGSGDELAVAAARAKEQAAAFASAVALLTGTDDDAEAVAGLGGLYGTLMEQVVLVQGLGEARGRTDVLSAAANSYNAGASAGQALAVYGEGPDADNLAELATAVGTFAEWVASIPDA